MSIRIASVTSFARLGAAVLVLGVAAAERPLGRTVALPNRAESIKFAVIGDNGTGGQLQYEVAQQMDVARRRFGFDLVIMLGDNFYGSQTPSELRRKFDLPYKPLLDAGVLFQAAIGNHDEPQTIHYPPLNMRGKRYYAFSRQYVRFIVLDTNAVDPAQLRWLDAELRTSAEPWKVAYFHHPLYGSASRHGGADDIRILLEPLLVKYGVSVVFSGHDHVYERLVPQQGITYFVCGAGGQLRKGDLTPSAITAAGFDRDSSFMLVEIGKDELWFETISRTGTVVDSGAIRRLPARAGS